MHIYIDEAGNFLPPTSQPSLLSLVLALIMPTSVEGDCLYEFLRIRDSWPAQGVEIKGSTLDEYQAAEVVALAVKYDLVVEFAALDMATHPDSVAEDFKVRQADSVTAHVTRDHYADVAHSLELLSRIVRGMSNQLFLQAFLMMKIVPDIIQTATLYFVQRKPAELGDIAWVIDRKAHKLTEMEEAWSTLVLPTSEFHFAQHPLIALKEADYSYFGRYETELETDPDMAAHVEWTRKAYGIDSAPVPKVLDAKKLLTEQQTFEDSQNNLGLQLADTLAAILRRALNNKLQQRGWKDFGRLLVRNSRDKSRYVQLGPGEGELVLQGHVKKVGIALEAASKSMIL